MLRLSGSTKVSSIPSALAHLGALAASRRNALLFVCSALAVFLLQPAMPIRQLDFWLPFASLVLVTWTWAATAPRAKAQDLRDGLALAAIVVLVALTRYVDPLSTTITRSRPPEIELVLIALAAVAGVAFILQRWHRPLLWWLGVAALISVLVGLKLEPLATALSAALRSAQGQSIAQAAAGDVRWLGISYLTFRLIHVLREQLTGRLPPLSLREFVTYAVFFPAIVAGPIDRAERFMRDLRAPLALQWDDVIEGARRIALGAFKKLVLADSLALIALNDALAAQTRPGIWAWVIVYAFALRLFLDFSGYTDIAIGIARWCGVRLPENFDRPYLKPNLTMFWNSWHMTLAQWFRVHYFTPLTRALRQRGMPPWAIIAFGQLSTMLLIGLWHGISANFAIWGLWHGVGLFVHNRWVEFARRHLSLESLPPLMQRAWQVASTLLTFHFVTLGWVWFALSTPALALRMFAAMIGLQI